MTEPESVRVIFTSSTRAFGPPICPICKHYLGDRRCKAYDIIPDELFVTGYDDHDRPRPDDNGVQFERIDAGESPFVVVDDSKIEGDD